LRFSLFYFPATPTTEIYPLSLHDALPISAMDDPDVVLLVDPDADRHAEQPVIGQRLGPQRIDLEDRRLHELRLTHLPLEERLRADRKSTRLNSSHVKISYAVFCLKKKKK